VQGKVTVGIRVHLNCVRNAEWRWEGGLVRVGLGVRVKAKALNSILTKKPC
jgi:hypothetical protein